MTYMILRLNLFFQCVESRSKNCYCYDL